jgi:hypothetical protein
MSKNPRSFRVPVLRLSDVYQGDSVNADPAQDDLLEPTPNLEQIQNGQQTEQTPEFVDEPVHTTETPQQTNTPPPQSAPPAAPAPAETSTQNPETTPSPEEGAGDTQADPSPSPWSLNPSADRKDTLNVAPAPEPEQAPEPKPAPPPTAPLPKPVDPFEVKAVEEPPDIWELAANKPAPVVEAHKKPPVRRYPVRPLAQKTEVAAAPQQNAAQPATPPLPKKEAVTSTPQPAPSEVEPTPSTAQAHAESVPMKPQPEDISPAPAPQAPAALQKEAVTSAQQAEPQKTEPVPAKPQAEGPAPAAAPPTPVIPQSEQPSNSLHPDVKPLAPPAQTVAPEGMAKVPLEPTPELTNLGALRMQAAERHAEQTANTSGDTPNTDAKSSVQPAPSTSPALGEQAPSMTPTPSVEPPQKKQENKDAAETPREATTSGTLAVQPTRPGAPQDPTKEPERVPQTAHARALANVAHQLTSIRDSESLSPQEDTRIREAGAASQAARQPQQEKRYGAYRADDLVVKPELGGEQQASKGVQMIRTFKSDIEQAVNRDRVSVVKMIADEENKRHEPEAPEVRKTTRKHFSVRSYAVVLVVLLLLGGTIALGTFAASVWLKRDANTLRSEQFFSDTAHQFDITDMDRTTIMQGLTNIRDTIEISPNEVVEISLTKRIPLPNGDEEQTIAVTASEFLRQLDTKVPGLLLRNIQDSFVFGIHMDNAGTRNPFLALRASVGGIVFSGMLAWESSLDVDLAPLFGPPIDRELLARTVEAQTGVLSSNTGTSSADAIDESSPIPIAKIDLQQIGLYSDVKIANLEARVMRNPSGVIQLLWVMTPDNSRLLITTSADALREVFNRS